MEFIQSLSFPLRPESGLIFESIYKKWIIHTNGEGRNQDPLIKNLHLEEFLMYPLWLNSKPWGIIIADNYVTKKTISAEDTKFFAMFMEQARGAIENSQSFENTLTKSHTDPLTSLWNYGYFQYRLDEEMAKAESLKNNLSVMMIDIDDFKRFNDTQGHIQGDTALKYISRILSGNCRKEDILCRYGGEEFSLILPENDKEMASFLGERMRQSVEIKDILNYRFTISIGIATYPQDGKEKISLLKKADSALYEAKNQGKNRVIIAS
ncbi:MAG: diguanylate cyclase [Candidatus Omnitrophica bacterium]|nr:diguanylate cyclase [Candidatus Omnitrophota bacterium]